MSNATLEQSTNHQQGAAGIHAGSADYYRAKIAEWRARIAETGPTIERMAEAILWSEDATQRDEIGQDMRVLTNEREALRNAVAVARYRLGESLWVWPKNVPWRGF